MSISRDELYKRYKYRKLMEKNGCRFNNYLINSFKGQFKLISQYNGYNSIVKIKCNHCGFIIDNKTPLQFKRNPGCPVCDSQIKQTEKSFMWRLQNLYGDQYTLLSDFKNVDTQVYLFHKDCGKIIKIYPKTLLTGSQCYYCYGVIPLTYCDVYQRLHRLSPDIFLMSMKDTKRPIKIRYMSCRHERTSLLSQIKKFPTCPICRKLNDRRKRALSFDKELTRVGLVSLRQSYINQTTKIMVKCNQCGYEWDTNPGPLLFGHGCPKCHSSNGECLIQRILGNNKIKYVYPKSFDELRGSKKPLHYDFYLPEQNTLIEYQGLQHYEPIDYFGGLKQFKIQQRHDNLKREYAKKHGYKLIEIPYTIDGEDNIKKFLIQKGLDLQ